MHQSTLDTRRRVASFQQRAINNRAPKGKAVPKKTSGKVSRYALFALVFVVMGGSGLCRRASAQSEDLTLFHHQSSSSWRDCCSSEENRVGARLASSKASETIALSGGLQIGANKSQRKHLTTVDVLGLFRIVNFLYCLLYHAWNFLQHMAFARVRPLRL